MQGLVDKSLLNAVIEVIDPHPVDKAHLTAVLYFDPSKIYLGATKLNKAFYLGSKPVDSLYLGATQVY